MPPATTRRVPDPPPPIQYSIVQLSLIILFSKVVPKWFALTNPDLLIAILLVCGIVYLCLAKAVTGLAYCRDYFVKEDYWILWYEYYYLLEVSVQQFTFFVALAIALVNAELLDLIFISTHDLYAFAIFAILALLLSNWFVIKK